MATAVIDFWVSVFIIFVIVAFFFIASFTAEEKTQLIQGEVARIDGGKLALQFVQASVETEDGMTTFGDLLGGFTETKTETGIVRSYGGMEEEEFLRLTKEYFDHYCAASMGKAIDVAIYTVLNYQEERVLNYGACQGTAFYGEVDPMDSIRIPLQRPKDYARIEVYMY